MSCWMLCIPFLRHFPEGNLVPGIIEDMYCCAVSAIGATLLIADIYE